MPRHLGIALFLLLTAGAAVGQTPPRAALLLFLGGGPHDGVPVPVSELRRFTTARARGVLTAAGWDLVDAADIDPARRDWRIRSGQKLDPGFLDACAATNGAEAVIVLELLSRQDLLVGMARVVSCPDGGLRDVAIAERPAPAPVPATDEAAAGPAAWQLEISALLAETLGALGGSARPDSLAAVVVLPLEAVGTTPDLDLAATYVHLAGILESGRMRVLDPAVVASALLDAGLQPRWLGGESRRVLEKTFGVERALIPTLVSYEAPRPAARVTVIDDAALPALSLRDFVLGLRAVDVRRGHVLADRQVYVDLSQAIGWFGRRPEFTLLETLGQAARTLRRDFLKDLEED